MRYSQALRLEQNDSSTMVWALNNVLHLTIILSDEVHLVKLCYNDFVQLTYELRHFITSHG
jgi:hypothetical protein